MPSLQAPSCTASQDGSDKFRAWHLHTDICAVQVVSLVIHRMQASCLFRAFSAWAARCKDKAAARQRLIHAVAALRNSQLMRCWVSWLGFTDARLAAKERILSAVLHWRERTASKCFRQWKQHMTNIREAHSKAEGILKRILCMLKVSARFVMSWSAILTCVLCQELPDRKPLMPRPGCRRSRQ